MDFGTVWILVQYELRTGLRNRWFAVYSIAFAVLALSFSFLSMAGAGYVGLAGYGRTAASLINLVLLIVPLIALTIGAQSLAADAERGTLGYLLAQPVTRTEVFVGKYLGAGLSMLASLGLGFGIVGFVLAWSGSGVSDLYGELVILALALGLAMLGVGVLVSASTRRAGVAVGVGHILWLAFVFVGDLGMMGTAIVLRIPIDTLFWVALANPLQVFKMAAVNGMEASMDVLGPAGLYATQRFGPAIWFIFGAAFLLWIVVPALTAFLRFVREEDLV